MGELRQAVEAKQGDSRDELARQRTHEDYVKDVVAYAIKRAKSDARVERLRRAKVVYGVGDGMARGVTRYGAWKNGDLDDMYAAADQIGNLTVKGDHPFDTTYLKELIDRGETLQTQADFMRLPLAERRDILARQAEQLRDYYEQSADQRLEWQAGDFVDEPELFELHQRLAVRGAVPEVSSRHDDPVRDLPVELIEKLHHDRFLAFQPKRVNRVHQVEPGLLR